ncbi:hypothetical protein GBF38_004718 [Nibea albiflora]|uniref:Uncharacterized protein n=1 Tax=Nibea albiflora TaxID=240163 RepID=A0ACB7FDE4_NIBAL|nr:hypothetical protein GBF38_004718 [Nibea albiflora]
MQLIKDGGGGGSSVFAPQPAARRTVERSFNLICVSVHKRQHMMAAFTRKSFFLLRASSSPLRLKEAAQLGSHKLQYHRDIKE